MPQDDAEREAEKVIKACQDKHKKARQIYVWGYACASCIAEAIRQLKQPKGEG